MLPDRRKTWESIPAKFRPLKSRLNVVLTRQAQGKENQTWPEGVLAFNSLDAALQATKLDCTRSAHWTTVPPAQVDTLTPCCSA